MASWIDEQNWERRRSLGIAKALNQDHHAVVNGRYPGLTREHCFLCEAETGRAGKHDDSIYDSAGEGPYCEECFHNHPERFDEA